MADQGQTESFIAALTELGGSAGNGRLREALQWDDATYSQVKDDLVAAGVIAPGRGRGGSVQLTSGTDASAPEKVKQAARAPKEKPMKPANNTGGDLGFEADLFKAADKLRGNLEPSEYKHVALGLIFLKYISEAFEAQHTKLSGEDYADAEDPEEYLAANVFWGLCQPKLGPPVIRGA